MYVPTYGGTSDLREVVERFYAAIGAADVAALSELIDAAFAPDVVVREPDSLVYGGTYEGIEQVKRAFSGIASPRSPLDASKLAVDQIIEAVTESDRLGYVFAAISFPLRSPRASTEIPMRALEWWTFRDLHVARLEAFYWDTAACEGLLRGAVSGG
jgi:ketosteroid isomerase-like protein